MQTKHHHSFDKIPSELVRLFIEKVAPVSICSPQDAMAHCVEKLCAAIGRSGPVPDLAPYRAARNIDNEELIENQGCDGWLRPKGTAYASGFTLGVCRDVAIVRQRFTIAHELCHTFFYELVPELKFQPHTIDLQEERLCDFGAACLLLSAESLRADAKERSVSVATLDNLSKGYGVSRKAMFLRLRELGIWKCELAVWQPTTDGRFILETVLGGRHGLEWEWPSNSIPRAIWNGASQKGRTWIQLKDRSGSWAARRVYFDGLRLRNRIFTLWSKWPLPISEAAPLFSNEAMKPNQRKRGRRSTAPIAARGPFDSGLFYV